MDMWTGKRRLPTCPQTLLRLLRRRHLGAFRPDGSTTPGMIGCWPGLSLRLPRRRWLLWFEGQLLPQDLQVWVGCELPDPNHLVRIGLKTGQALVLVVNGDMPIQMLTELHASPSIAALVRSWRDLQFVSCKGYRVVVCHGALMAEAETLLELVVRWLISIG